MGEGDGGVGEVEGWVGGDDAEGGRGEEDGGVFGGEVVMVLGGGAWIRSLGVKACGLVGIP